MSSQLDIKKRGLGREGRIGDVGGTTGIGEDEEGSEDWEENHVFMVS